MEYLPLIIIFVSLLVPIFLPLIYWYFIKNRDSKVYSICRKIRRVWAVLIIGLIAYKAYQLPQREVSNVFEVIGEFFGQMLIAYLLWKFWKKEEVISDADKAEVIS